MGIAGSKLAIPQVRNKMCEKLLAPVGQAEVCYDIINVRRESTPTTPFIQNGNNDQSQRLIILCRIVYIVQATCRRAALQRPYNQSDPLLSIYRITTVNFVYPHFDPLNLNNNPQLHTVSTSYSPQINRNERVPRQEGYIPCKYYKEQGKLILADHLESH